MRTPWTKVRAYVRERALELRSNRYSDLASLPESTPLDAPKGLEKLQFYIWSKHLDDGTVRIRVEAFRNYLFGIYSRSVWDGFDIAKSGQVTEIPEGDYR
jgi:hypothetical protein